MEIICGQIAMVTSVTLIIIASIAVLSLLGKVVYDQWKL
jgi:hypothetical protein